MKIQELREAIAALIPGADIYVDDDGEIEIATHLWSPKDPDDELISHVLAYAVASPTETLKGT